IIAVGLVLVLEPGAVALLVHAADLAHTRRALAAYLRERGSLVLVEQGAVERFVYCPGAPGRGVVMRGRLPGALVAPGLHRLRRGRPGAAKRRVHPWIHGPVPAGSHPGGPARAARVGLALHRRSLRRGQPARAGHLARRWPSPTLLVPDRL